MKDFELDTTIEISQKDIADIDFFMENYLISAMNESGMSFAAMEVILQTVLKKRDELSKILESGEDSAL